jgi:hypothetical protein
VLEFSLSSFVVVKASTIVNIVTKKRHPYLSPLRAAGHKPKTARPKHTQQKKLIYVYKEGGRKYLGDLDHQYLKLELITRSGW